MERLPASTLRALLAFLTEVTAACLLDAFPERVLAELQRLIPGDSVSYNEVNLARQRTVSLVRPAAAAPPEFQPIFEHHVAEHPLIVHYERTGDGRARTI